MEASGGTEIVRKYCSRTKKSRQLMTRAEKSMPGGNTRTTVFYPPYPVVFCRGEGPWLWDVDGNRYVDCYYNGLSIIHGHCHGPTQEAVGVVLRHGTAWCGASREQIEFAELLTHRIPGSGLARFANSGSEAAMIAVKVVRKVTGRPAILKFERAFHGSYPDLEAGLYGQGEIADRTLLARFNDFTSCERALRRHGNRIAAIMFEPVMFTGRVIVPAEGFLTDLQALARRYGILMILDDCLMFRLAQGGSSEKYGLDPDLVVLGKFIGGGTPLGAVVGRNELMGVLDPRKPGSMFHGGSFNGNALGCAAGLVTLRHLTATSIRRMDSQAEKLRRRLEARAASLGIRVAISGTGSVGGIAFAADPTRHEDNPSAVGLSALFHLACLNESVAIGPGGLFGLATAVDDDSLRCATRGMEAALDAVAEIQA